MPSRPFCSYVDGRRFAPVVPDEEEPLGVLLEHRGLAPEVHRHHGPAAELVEAGPGGEKRNVEISELCLLDARRN